MDIIEEPTLERVTVSKSWLEGVEMKLEAINKLLVPISQAINQAESLSLSIRAELSEIKNETN